MARVFKNAIIQGLIGSLGGQIVLRQDSAGRTIVSLRPTFRADRTFSERQKAQQERFRQAVAYAKAASRDEPAYQARAGGGRSAFNLAVADWFNPPQIVEADLSAWTGEAGQPIRIRATDDFQVRQVSVAIGDGAGAELEAGPAARVDGWWVYTTRAPLPADSTVRATAAVYVTAAVYITAVDLPGHVAQAEVRKD
jgi:hypothetical protein